jgi:hypothetical protein
LTAPTAIVAPTIGIVAIAAVVVSPVVATPVVAAVVVSAVVAAVLVPAVVASPIRVAAFTAALVGIAALACVAGGRGPLLTILEVFVGRALEEPPLAGVELFIGLALEAGMTLGLGLGLSALDVRRSLRDSKGRKGDEREHAARGRQGDLGSMASHQAQSSISSGYRRTGPADKCRPPLHRRINAPRRESHEPEIVAGRERSGCVSLISRRARSSASRVARLSVSLI